MGMDESALLSIEKVEAHFEKSPEQVKEEEQSTFAKLGAKISDFFGSSKGEQEAMKPAAEGEKEAAPEKEAEGDKKPEEEKKEEKKEEPAKEEPKKEEPKEEKKEEAPKTEETKANA